jgi:hypothetical protein
MRMHNKFAGWAKALFAVPTTLIEECDADWWARKSGAHSRDPLALPTLRNDGNK